MRNNIITASRMVCIQKCLRQHYWQYEIGLRKTDSALALRLGSAWARAMEARWAGATYQQALGCSIPEGIELDDYQCETVAALLAGYYDFWGKRENCGKIQPEYQFHTQIDGADGWESKGMLDGIGKLKDGSGVIIENKTTSDSIDPDSDYWIRLHFNVQILQYITEAIKLGFDIQSLYYDVVHKPTIKPKMVDVLDKNEKKIVLDRNGKRVLFEAGKNKGQPRQTSDKAKGYLVKSHIETLGEFSDRLWKDTVERPQFYFTRRQVPILDDVLETFKIHRLNIIKLIEHLRAQEQFEFDPEPWMRFVASDTCKYCVYKSFCLQNTTINTNNPPEGFEIKSFNPELESK